MRPMNLAAFLQAHNVNQIMIAPLLAEAMRRNSA